MPDESRAPGAGDIDLMADDVSGTWRALRLAGPARACLTSDALMVDSPQGASARVALVDVSGAVSRPGALTLHGEAGTLTITAKVRLDALARALVDRACPIPELARGHRRLGSPRGGALEAQAKFLAPFMQVRRDLQAERDLERRVTSLKAGVLRERLNEVLTGMASEAYPTSAPDRRGLRAELDEAMAPISAAIDRVDQAARAFIAMDESKRFDGWRAWITRVAELYSLADRAWLEVSSLVPGGRR